ncbi:MAG: hypothetical protein AAFO75_03670 [Pseudomonadota bacterium]
MQNVFEMSDVPAVSETRMFAALELLIATGQTSVLFKGHDTEVRSLFEERFWQEFHGNTADGVAILIRLWSLIDVLQTRRMADRLMKTGFNILKPLAQAAASIRLNTSWGFAPQKVLWVVDNHTTLSETKYILSGKTPIKTPRAPLATNTFAALNVAA